jgi:hypothetical protein
MNLPILTLIVAGVAAGGVAQPPPTPCKSWQAKKPPYTFYYRCKEDCAHIPKPVTVKELIASGIDPRSAAGIVNFRTRYWHRACPKQFQK